MGYNASSGADWNSKPSRRSNDIANFEGFEVMSVDQDSLFSDEQRRIAFRVLAEEGNDAKAAIARLDAEHRMCLTQKDLVRWRDKKFPQLYVEVHSEYQRELERDLEARARDNAVRAIKTGQKLLARIDDEVSETEDIVALSKALDAVTKHTTASTNATLQLSGRPVDGSSNNLGEILRGLQSLGVLTVDGSAEEITEEATVVDVETGER